MDESLRKELNGLLDTIDRLQLVATMESTALNRSETEMTEVAVARLRDAHLAELDVIHSLVARVALLRRRHPDLARDEPNDRSPSTASSSAKPT